MNSNSGLPTHDALDNCGVVITGAAGGLGRAHAEACLAAGATVFLTDLPGHHLEGLALHLDPGRSRVGWAEADIRDASQVERIARDAVRLCGHLDGWINNAGAIAFGRVDRVPLASIRHLIDVNVLGTVNGLLAAADVMTSQGHGGAVVNTTSGTQNGNEPDTTGYGMTKGAVTSLTYGAAADLAPEGIRVNAISPLAQTKMIAARDTHYVERGYPAIFDNVPPAHASAAAAVYLLSQRAAKITGRVIRIDEAGYSIVSKADPGPVVVDRSSVASFDDLADGLDAILRGPQPRASQASAQPHTSASENRTK